MQLDVFVSKWQGSQASERANKDAYLLDLCAYLDVPKPDPTTGDSDRDRYVFERDVVIAHAGGKHSIGKADLYRHGAFLLEAKQGADKGAKKTGFAKRNTPAWHAEMDKAFGQALGYVRSLDAPPPFLVVTDIGFCFDLYADFDGSRTYRPFPDAQHSRIFVEDLAKHRETFRAIWNDPRSLDPSRRAARVTREVAVHLAELAKALEADGHKPETVARFLMRCIFTMFAEDVGLLPERTLTDQLAKRWIDDPSKFPDELEALWRAMNDGSVVPFLGKLLKFNGGLFRDPKAIALKASHLKLLLEAATCGWGDVEPAIFGTLVERALDPKERHRLGAHYTPRAYVERLVRPTIEEPLRAEWEAVRAEVHRLVGADTEAGVVKGKTSKKVIAARKAVKAFHTKLCATRVLDPACGSGNFLYVAMEVLKRIESEVLAMLSQLGGEAAVLDLEGVTVTPAQFLGIEKKRWAKEIAELVLWIGFLQWHARTRRNKDGKVLWPEPVLKDLHNIECRDAVLAWDGEVPVLDDAGKPVTRWDGETYKKHPATGADVPDDSARGLVQKLVNPRRAEWPKADFIVGNPPFLGAGRMRQALGDGYVDALRGTHDDVPESCDLVMYWWSKAATLVRDARLRSAGLITTTSITHAFSRRVIDRYLSEQPPVSIAFGIADHPWVTTRYGSAGDGAEVRVAMTVIVPGTVEGTVGVVRKERLGSDGEPIVTMQYSTGTIYADLKIGADVASARSLLANSRLVSRGVQLFGKGFEVTREQAASLGLGQVPNLEKHIREYRNGKDVADRARNVMVIDLYGLDEIQVRESFPAAYQWILERVQPERAHNRRELYFKRWWIFGEARSELRRALAGLARYIVTPETARRRYFTFLSGEVLPDNALVVTTLDDSFFLGVLSSRAHTVWALAAGGGLGVRHEPRYNKTRCFDPFPFPDANVAQRERIRALASQIDAHRETRKVAHPTLTLNSMYSVLERLRAGQGLTISDKVIHEQGLVSVLKQLHDELDAAVFDAYGWPATLTDDEILARVVALNAERAAEEARGEVRWLRPEFQQSAGATSAQAALPGGEDDEPEAVALPGAEAWPTKMAEQLAAVLARIQQLGGAASAAEIAAGFKGAGVVVAGEVLDALSSFGRVAAFGDGDVTRWKALVAAA